MDDTYRFLRRVEHRLQIVFDRQTHEMPRDLEALRTLAIRMGYAPASAWEDRTGPAHAVPGRLPQQDRAEPADPQPPAARRLPRRRRARPSTRSSTWCSTPIPSPS